MESCERSSISHGDAAQLKKQEHKSAMSEEKEMLPDYSKFNEDSVPPPEKEIKHTHKGRPDLDYEDTKVGPAQGVDYVPAEKLKETEGKHKK